MGNISAPIFGSATPQQLMALLAARQPDPATKVADPVKVKAFNDANPEVLLQGRYLASQPVPASFATVNYWGVHAFGFTNASGVKQFGKWIFEPVNGTQGLSDEEAKEKGASFLFDDLRQRVKEGKVAFNFNLELAQPGDQLDNATVPLPEGRKKINLGVLKITSVSDDDKGACLTVNFNPMIMPNGVEPSNDPMLSARAAPYAVALDNQSNALFLSIYYENIKEIKDTVAEFKKSENNKIIKEWFGKTVIYSDHRFAYEEAQELIETQKPRVSEHNVRV